MKTLAWRPKMALILAMSLGAVPILPLVTPTTASAQVFRNNGSSRRNRTFRIVEGTYIPAAYEDGDTTKIVVTPDETLDLTLTTTSTVRSTRGSEIIPAGSKIIGQIEPYQDGVRFVGETLELPDGTRESIQVSSEVVTRREEVDGRRGNGDSIWQGALVGGAAATIISATVTDVGIFKTLLGAGAGALAGHLLGGRKRSSKEVVILDPERDFNLVVDEEFLLSRRFARR